MVTRYKLKGESKARLTMKRAAELLNVHRVHLSYVVHGHRKSRSLSKRYAQLIREHKS